MQHTFTKRQLISVLYKSKLSLDKLDAIWEDIGKRQLRRRAKRALRRRSYHSKPQPTQDWSIPLETLYND